jgi:hypothetical protein
LVHLGFGAKARKISLVAALFSVVFYLVWE